MSAGVDWLPDSIVTFNEGKVALAEVERAEVEAELDEANGMKPGSEC